MMHSETWITALDALRCNKLRVCLAMFGVMIGSACIIMVVTVSLTARRYVMEQIEAIGSNLVYANYEFDPQQPSARSFEITLADLDAVKSDIPDVTEVAGTRQMPASVQIEGREVPANLVGVTERFQAIRKLVILRGRYFDDYDSRAHTKVCLITADLAERVSPGEDPVGKSIRIGEMRFDIVGVFAERVASFESTEIQRDSVLVPFEHMRYLTGEDSVVLLYAQARTPSDVLSVTRSVQRLLTSRHPGPAVYRVRNLGPILKLAEHIALTLKSVMLIIALIAMLSSGVGIMNIMLTSVAERTQEIGIRRAFGAQRVQILYQFLLEALVISLTGALAGILLGLAVPEILQPLVRGDVTVEFSWLSPLWAMLVSCLFGLFFGFLPANIAAKLDPAESLRCE